MTNQHQLRTAWAAITSAAEAIHQDDPVQLRRAKKAGDQLWAELERLWSMEKRARSIVAAGSVDDPDAARGWYLAARDILGEG